MSDLGSSTAPMVRVLVVDDEPTVREVVVRYLQRDGYDVAEASDAPTTMALLASFVPHVVVLDVMLPAGGNGLDILRAIRSTDDPPAVILLTARAEEADRVLGLELGADDYVVKPFSPRELVARVRSVLRRSARTSPTSTTRLVFDGLVIDPAAREVVVDGVTAALTAKEFDLLAFLAGHPRQVFSRAELLDQVWDSSIEYQDPATVTVHVRRIRNKIEHDPEAPRWISTVWGVGYRFEP